MSQTHPAEPEVYTVQEVARAAGVLPAEVRALVAAGEASPVSAEYLSFDDAVRLVRAVRAAVAQPRSERLFAATPGSKPRRGAPLMLSGALHAVLVAMAVFVTGASGSTGVSEARVEESPRLVFLVTPGPGGGGGGGGLRQPSLPPPARLSGRSPVRSPVTVPRRAEPRQSDTPVVARSTPDPPVPAPAAPEPQPPVPEVTPPILAPVVSMAADEDDEAGALADSAMSRPSHGPGEGGGVGAGRGSGTGEGHGAGIGEGSIAGTGGGPYRPGSGITPPSLQREVKPVYTEEARRRGVEGDVLLEVVVRADGTVGAIRIVRGLGAGLDERAVGAVRQWLFSPARRFGTAVDVLVEVAVEFRLR